MKRLLALLLIVGCWSSASWATVGYREWTRQGLRISVWYPSASPASQRQLGPFELSYAFDGTPRRGPWPVLVFSHGNNGQVHNHYLTLQALAHAGYVVIAPQHGSDGVAKTLDVSDALSARVRDIDRAIDAVYDDPELGRVVSRKRVNALGYGLGGTTVLLAAGANLEQDAIDAHCKRHADEDMDLCSNDPVSAVKQKLGALFSNFSRASSIEAASRSVSVHGAVAVVAPMGQGLAFQRDQLLVSRLLSVAIDGDVIRPPQYHANAIYKALPGISTLLTVPGHHYAFLAPLPSWMMKKEEYFTVNDPPNFDREAFLRHINSALLRFFNAR